jgi:hypothetical protein
MNNQEDELELSVVTPETCIAVALDHRIGGLPKASDFAFLQTALLYTNPWTGDRRIRVSTLALRTSSHPQNVVDGIDFSALAAMELRVHLPHGNYPTASQLSLSLDNNSASSQRDVATPDQRGDNLLTKAREGVKNSCVQVLKAYRQQLSKQRMPPLSEFVVPDSLRLWPLFVMSALKSPLLRPSLPRRGTGTQTMVPSPRGDERAYYLYFARKVSPSTALHLVHPFLFDLGKSLEATNSEGERHFFEWRNLQEPGTPILDVMSSLKRSPVVDFPRPLPASVSNLAEDGIYLLDTCFALYVLIEREAHDIDNQLESKIRNAATQLQLWSQVGRQPMLLRPMASRPILMIHQKGEIAQYQALLRWMVLDATSQEKDFANFCIELNKKIQT